MSNIEKKETVAKKPLISPGSGGEVERRKVSCSPAPGVQLSADEKLRFAGIKVLIVDDSALIQKTIYNHLKNLGISFIHVANDGQEAVNKLSEQGAPDYQLVLMDIDMPKLNGLDATKEIRAKQRWENVSIVAISGNEDPDTKKKAESAGINGFFRKPVNPRVIETIIRQYVFKEPMPSSPPANVTGSSTARMMNIFGGSAANTSNDNLIGASDLKKSLTVAPPSSTSAASTPSPTPISTPTSAASPDLTPSTLTPDSVSSPVLTSASTPAQYSPSPSLYDLNGPAFFCAPASMAASSLTLSTSPPSPNAPISPVNTGSGLWDTMAGSRYIS